MSPEDFSLYPELDAALARDAEDGKPPYELVVPRRAIVEDVALAPPTATYIATRGTADHLARIPELEQLRALWANPASPALFELCARASALEAIYVCHFKRLSNVPIGGAPRLAHLMLGWAPQLADLSFLAELPALRTIYLEDMKRIDLQTLPQLPRVTGLHLGGGMWSPLKVESLAPLARLPRLRYLRLSNVRPADGRLDWLTRLRELRELYLPNFFELEEVARLAAALPNVQSNTLAPVYGVALSSKVFRCSQCGEVRQMMTGKPASILCPVCDAAKYQRRIARWKAARASTPL